ncbi:hypothetical protein COO60DRAFT_407655 [Scenedesmus sp. NREL 46B-D3]|nr:hypothetical protein COO60DRAFT_407655 [Scenedesmus sp. NREL 46B-D3]
MPHCRHVKLLHGPRMICIVSCPAIKVQYTAGNSNAETTLCLVLQVVIFNGSIKHNFAVPGGGGGAAAVDDARILLTNSTVQLNRAAGAGGGVRLAGRSNMAVSNSFIRLNTAYTGGGVSVAPDASLYNVSKVMAGLVSNSASNGPDLAAEPARLVLLSNLSMHGYVSRAAAEDGAVALRVAVSGALDLPAPGVLVAASMEGLQALGANTSDATGAVYLFLQVRRPPGRYVVSVALPEHAHVPPVNFSLQVRGCVPGEVSPIPDTCEACMPGFYSLDPSQALCSPCPAGAECPGGSAMLPLPGRWQSAATSAQMHRCPHPAACHGDRDALRACSQDAACRLSTSYTSLQCSPAHSGHVCGACADGFGATKPFHCRACLGRAAIIGLYVAGGVVLLAFIKLLCHFTLAENAQPQAGGDKQHVAVLLRCLVLYSQWMLLVASINIDWPPSISYPMQILGWVWAPSNPETVSIDCLLSASVGVPVAVQRVVFYISMPVVMLTVLLLLEATVFRATSTPSIAAVSTADQLGSNAMVIVFFFFPGVLRTVFGFFACVPLDRPVDAPHTAAAVGAFWVYDVSVVCFEPGWHRALSLGLGLPLAVLLCIGLPAAIVFITVSNRKHLDDAKFRRHWGFLTRSYSDARCWWEAVVVCQTTVLVTIHAFGVNMGALYQSVVMTAAFGTQLYLLMALRPYAYRPAGQAMLRGLQCLLLTSYVGLTFQLASRPVNSEVQPSAAYGLVMGAVLVLVNVVYICSVLWQLVRHVEWREVLDAVRGAGRSVQAWARSPVPCGECGKQADDDSVRQGSAEAAAPSRQPSQREEHVVP